MVDSHLTDLPTARQGCTRLMGCGGIGVLVVIAGAALLQSCSHATYERERQARQARLIAEIVDRGETIDQLPVHDADFLPQILREPRCAAKIEGMWIWTDSLGAPEWSLLPQFPRLTKIAVYDSSRVEKLLESIRGVRSLEMLNLIKVRMTEKGLVAIAGLPSLREFTLSYGFIEGSLLPLQGNAAIETIRLDGIPFTDEWLSVLATFRKLRQVDLTGISDNSESVARARSILSHCRIRVSESERGIDWITYEPTDGSLPLEQHDERQMGDR